MLSDMNRGALKVRKAGGQHGPLQIIAMATVIAISR
jgi:hypothetical protein